MSYDKNAYRTEADAALFTANFITSVLASQFIEARSVVGSYSEMESAKKDQWLYELARNNVQTHNKVMGSRICFANGVYRNYADFCPVARRNKATVDTSYLDYKFANDPWWNHIWRKTSRVAVNLSDDTFVFTKWENGTWTEPTYDCSGSQWVATYFVPFLHVRAGETSATVRFEFAGLVAVDVSMNLDVNQCDTESATDGCDSFIGTHLCDRETSVCERTPMQNQENGLGAYNCVCKKGFYALKGNAHFKRGDNVTGYQGSWLEANDYQIKCVPCSEGCEECVDDQPCVYRRNGGLQNIALILNVIGILTAICLLIFIVCTRKQKIVFSAIPVLLIMMLVGTIFLFLSSSARVLKESKTSCLLFRWVFNIGMSLFYGCMELRALYLWRDHQAYSARTKRLRLKPLDIYKLLVILMVIVTILLTVWTIISPPVPEEFTANGLKFQRCGFSHMSYFYVSFLIHLLLLGFGLYLSCQIYSVPSYFSEGKLLVISIINLTFIYTVMIILLIYVSSYNPDNGFLTYAIIVHLMCDVPMALLFGPRVYFIARGKGAMLMISSAEIGFRHTMTVAGYYISDDDLGDSSLRELADSGNDGSIDDPQSPNLLILPDSFGMQTTEFSEQNTVGQDNIANSSCNGIPMITVTAVANGTKADDEDIVKMMKPVTTHTFELITLNDSENRVKNAVDTNVSDSENRSLAKRKKSADDILDVEQCVENLRKSTTGLLKVNNANLERRRQSIDMLTGVKTKGPHGRRKTFGDIQPTFSSPLPQGRIPVLQKPMLLKRANPLPVVSPLAISPVMAQRQRHHQRRQFSRRASVAGEIFETVVEFSSTGEKLREETKVKNIYDVLLERQARRGSNIGRSRLTSNSTGSLSEGRHEHESISEAPHDSGIDLNNSSRPVINSPLDNKGDIDGNRDCKLLIDDDCSFDPKYGTSL